MINWKDERTISLMLLIISLWVLVNPIFVSATIGIIYSFFILIYIVMMESKTYQTIQVYTGRNILKILFEAVVFLFIIAFIFSGFEMINFSVFEDFSAYTNSILQTKTIFTKFVSSVLVPFAESFVFLNVVPQILSNIMNFNLNSGLKIGLVNVIILCFFVGVIASLFHLYVRAMTSASKDISLDKMMVKDIIFFAGSMFMVLMSREMSSAILSHSIVNFMVG